MVPCLKGYSVLTSDRFFGWFDITDNTLVEEPSEDHMCLALDFQTGQALGIMVGNAWWTHTTDEEHLNWKDYRVFLSDMKGYQADALREWFGSVFEGSPVNTQVSDMPKWIDKSGRKLGDSVRHTFKAADMPKVMRFFCESLGGEKGGNHRGAGSKHLPKWTGCTSPAFRRGLLCGLIATDGTVSLATKKAGRSHGQLLISYTTISFKLARDIRSLCWQLGVKAKITFARTTSSGNKAWIVNLSTIDAKKNNLLAGICHPEKLLAFDSAVVDDGDKYIKRQVPFPAAVCAKVVKWIRSPLQKDWISEYCKEEAERRAGQAALYVILTRAVKTNAIPERAAQRIVEAAEYNDRMLPILTDFVNDLCIRIETGAKTLFTPEEISDLLRFLEVSFPYTNQLQRNHIVAMLSDSVRNGGVIPKTFCKEIKGIWNPGADRSKALSNEPEFILWKRLVVGDYQWASVVYVEKTGEKEVGYDITVPGYETFTSDTGVVLSNTMTYYVPVSQAAVDEAYRLMLPSKNQLSARDFTALPELQEELVSGAYLASHKKNKPPVAVFNTKAEALDAYRHNRIPIDANVIVKES